MGLIIKEVLKQRSLTINELADKLGMSRGGVSQIINGNPTVESLQKIADVLEIDISELFEQKKTIIACPRCGTSLKVELKI